MRARRMAMLWVLAAAAAASPAQQAFQQYVTNVYWPTGTTDPRALMLGPQGRVWVGMADGTIRILEDLDQDGTVDNVKTFIAGAWSPHGLAWRPHGAGWDVYVAHLTAAYGGTGQITRFVDLDGDDVMDSASTVVASMPTGAHQVNNIALEPGGAWLYFSQGATSNTQPGGGALIGRVSPLAQNLPWGSSQIQIHATGLRNAWGIRFHPQGDLFATDNGRDDPGPTAPPDEFNHILPGRDYGFPAVNGVPPPGSTTEAPVGLLPVHGSVNGFDFDRGSLMTGFKNQVFLAQWGAWTGSPSGRILQADLHPDGSGGWHMDTRDFLVGCGRPLDLICGAGGELFFTVQTPSSGWPLGVHRIVPAHGLGLKLDGVPHAGNGVSVTVHGSAHAGETYLVAASLGTGPIPTSLGPVGLSADALLTLSLSPNPWLVFNRPGTLDASGDSPGGEQVNIPAGLPAGTTIYLAAITVDPVTGALTGITPSARLKLF